MPLCGHQVHHQLFLPESEEVSVPNRRWTQISMDYSSKMCALCRRVSPSLDSCGSLARLRSSHSPRFVHIKSCDGESHSKWVSNLYILPETNLPNGMLGCDVLAQSLLRSRPEEVPNGWRRDSMSIAEDDDCREWKYSKGTNAWVCNDIKPAMIKKKK